MYIRFERRCTTDLNRFMWKRIRLLMEIHWTVEKEFEESFLDHIVYLMYRNEILVAVCFDECLEDRFAITNLAVRAKNKGYGTMLLDYIKTYHDEILLEVWNEPELIDFYSKQGFKVIKKYGEERPSHHNEQAIDVWLMEYKKEIKQ